MTMEHTCSKTIRNFLLLANKTHLFGLDMKGPQQSISSLFSILLSSTCLCVCHIIAKLDKQDTAFDALYSPILVALPGDNFLS